MPATSMHAKTGVGAYGSSGGGTGQDCSLRDALPHKLSHQIMARYVEPAVSTSLMLTFDRFISLSHISEQIHRIHHDRADGAWEIT